MNKNAYSRIVKASNYFDAYAIRRHTCVANTAHEIDLGSNYDQVKITVDGVDAYVLFYDHDDDPRTAVTVNSGYMLIGNEKHTFDLKTRYVSIISAGTPVIHVIGLR